MNVAEMLEKFEEDFEESLHWAWRNYEFNLFDRNQRYINQAKDFAFLAYHFGIIDDDKYCECLKMTDEFDMNK